MKPKPAHIDTQLLKAIALRIKELRQKKKISQLAFFQKTGINIYRIEHAKRNLSVSTLSDICKFFKVPLKDFVSGLDY